MCPTPDFNYDPGNDSNSGCFLALQHLVESDLNNGPDGPVPGHSNLVSDEAYICSSLVTILAMCPKPDFNNGLGNDFNNDVSKHIKTLHWVRHTCTKESGDLHEIFLWCNYSATTE